mgnify:CR=1 FL=1
METLHHAAVIERIGIEDRVRKEIPTNVARRVDDCVARFVVPFERPAHGVVPDGAATVGGLVGEVVDEVETVLEFGGVCPKSLSEIELGREERADTGFGELNRVLGGGIVKGSLVLVGGGA